MQKAYYCILVQMKNLDKVFEKLKDFWNFSVNDAQTRWYSLSSKKATVGHKNFSFCEQTRHKGLIDASCGWLQSTPKNRGQNKFLRKLRAKIQFLRLLFSSLRSISSYNPHTILKKCATRSTKNIYLFLFTEAPSRPRRRGLPRASICNKEHGTY